MMQLSAHSLKDIHKGNISIPQKELLGLPEKVLQFGTGVLLRALPDYFIDKANKLGIFNGRIVVVKSTERGNESIFKQQDNLYSICVRGISGGAAFEENIINCSISRVLQASNEWKEILSCAHNPEMKVIISNTTEIGIKLVDDDIRLDPPISFPGKLLAFLYERFIVFGGSGKSGFVIIPTELIPDNGKKLESIVLELASRNNLGAQFIEWLQQCNNFCNSLVDRIVPGQPAMETKTKIETELGYKDDLLTVCEVYRLWAIEGDESIKKLLSFAGTDDGLIIEPDIELYRELKLRLLNGTHTLSCGIAFLAGIDTVKKAMDNETMYRYISNLMQLEIAPSVPFVTNMETLNNFVATVLDRFRNPQIDHFWKRITLNYTHKMKLRCVPILFNFYKKNDAVPELFALGFSAYITFMKPVKHSGKEFFGEFSGQYYLIEDEMAEIFFIAWQQSPTEKIVKTILQNITLWGKDLTQLPDFEKSVADKVEAINSQGMKAVLEAIVEKKIFV